MSQVGVVPYQPPYPFMYPHDHSNPAQSGLIDPSVVDHDLLLNFVGAEHLSLPNTIANILTNHTKPVHDALALDHESLSNIISCSCRAYRNANQIINTGVWTKVLFNAEDYDIGGKFDADGIDSNFKAPSTAKYILYSNITFGLMPDGKIIDMMIYDHTADHTIATFRTVAAGTQDHNVTGLTISELILNHFYHIYVKHDAGVAKSILGDRNRAFISIHRLGS